MAIGVFAYVGPGAGLSAIGAFLALVGGIFIAIFGFVWYPMKRLVRFLKERNPDAESPDSPGRNPAEP